MSQHTAARGKTHTGQFTETVLSHMTEIRPEFTHAAINGVWACGTAVKGAALLLPCPEADIMRTAAFPVTLTTSAKVKIEINTGQIIQT